jgi:hypothetical protein
MATAKTIPNVELELTAKEASVLLAVLNKIGGDPCGPRGQCDNINNALTGVGVRPASIAAKPTDSKCGLVIS